jgi:hypothetical protein
MIRRDMQRDNPVRMGIIVIFALTALIALVLLLAAPYAHGAADRASIDYLASGVGADEIERLRAREKEFNLKLVFTLVEGNYVSDVAVIVKDKAGNPVLVVFSPGPVVLAKLPPGSYVVEATYESNMQTRKVDVRERLRTEYVRWPSNPATDFPGPKATERE